MQKLQFKDNFKNSRIHAIISGMGLSVLFAIPWGIAYIAFTIFTKVSSEDGWGSVIFCLAGAGLILLSVAMFGYIGWTIQPEENKADDDNTKFTECICEGEKNRKLKKEQENSSNASE